MDIVAATTTTSDLERSRCCNILSASKAVAIFLLISSAFNLYLLWSHHPDSGGPMVIGCTICICVMIVAAGIVICGIEVREAWPCIFTIVLLAILTLGGCCLLTAECSSIHIGWFFAKASPQWWSGFSIGLCLGLGLALVYSGVVRDIFTTGSSLVGEGVKALGIRTKSLVSIISSKVVAIYDIIMAIVIGVGSRQPNVALLPPPDVAQYSEQELDGLFGVTLEPYKTARISGYGADVLVGSWISFIQLTRDVDVSNITLGLMNHDDGSWTVKCPGCGCTQVRFWSAKIAGSYLPARSYSRDLHQLEFYVREDRGDCAIVASHFHRGRDFHIAKRFLTRN